MMNNMNPDERQKLIDEITAKLPELDDAELMTIASENRIRPESPADLMPKDDLPSAAPSVIDTKMLTGPVNSLKNFLIKKTRDNDEK